jgi:hypothetical protein
VVEFLQNCRDTKWAARMEHESLWLPDDRPELTDRGGELGILIGWKRECLIEPADRNKSTSSVGAIAGQEDSTLEVDRTLAERLKLALVAGLYPTLNSNCRGM